MGIIIVCTKILHQQKLPAIRYAAYNYGSNFNDFESLERDLSNGAIKVQIKVFANFPIPWIIIAHGSKGEK